MQGKQEPPKTGVDPVTDAPSAIKIPSITVTDPLPSEDGLEVVAQETPSYHTVAVGSGPVGLLAALSALQHCKLGEKVAILADRKEELGVRQQVLWIQEDVFQFVKKLVGEELMDQYMAELAITEDEEDGYYLTTGDFEKLLYAALSEYTIGEHYDFIEVQKIAPPQKITDAIQVDKENSVISVQGLAVNNVKLGDGPQTCSLNFKHLVAADGARRTVAKAMGEEDVIFADTQSPMHHSKHVVASFRIPEGTTPQVCSKLKVYPGASGPETVSMPVVHEAFTRDIDPCSLGKLKTEFGWKGHTRPHSQIYATRDVVYIGAEIPADLPKDKAREYALLMMRDQLPKDYIDRISEIPCDMSTAYGRKMAQLKVSVFDIELGEINKTLQVCANEDESEIGVIFYMGDAKKNPLYTTGTGVQTGVREVMGFDTYLESMDKPKLDTDERTDKQRLRAELENYHFHAQTILGTIRDVQDNWVSGRVKKEKEAQKNFQLFSQHKKSISELNTFITEVNEVHGSLPTPIITEVPEFLTFVHSKLNELQDKYKKVCSCCRGENFITSYNGVDVEGMINDFQKIKAEFLTKYPSLERLIDEVPGPAQQLVSECYKEFLDQFKTVVTPSLSKIGLFSSPLPTITEEPEDDNELNKDGLIM